MRLLRIYTGTTMRYLLLLFSTLVFIVDSLSIMTVSAKLKDLGITIRAPTAPKGNYCLCVRTGNLLHLCGHIPQKDDGSLIKGRVGQDMTVEEGYVSARCCAENILNTLHQELDGDWTRVVRIVKLVGFVNSADDFEQQPAVMNGASDLFVQVFGDAGLHARSAVGTNVLPLGVATEVEAIIEIRD